MEKMPTIILPDGAMFGEHHISKLPSMAQTDFDDASIGEGLPFILRMGSVRMRVHRPSHLVSEFYVKRLGMQQLRHKRVVKPSTENPITISVVILTPEKHPSLPSACMHAFQLIGKHSHTLRMSLRRRPSGSESMDSLPCETSTHTLAAPSSNLLECSSNPKEGEVNVSFTGFGFFEKNVGKSQFLEEAAGTSDCDVERGWLGSGFKQFLLEFVDVQQEKYIPYDDKPSDAFSRIAVAINDVDALVLRLSQSMLRVLAAQQFLDISYASAVLDPQNIRLRILQRINQYQMGVVRSAYPMAPLHSDSLEAHIGDEPVSGELSRACLGVDLLKEPVLHHAEIRSADIDKAVEFYEKVLGMSLIERKDASSFGFSFLFFSFEHPNMCAKHSQWIWQQAFSCVCVKAYNTPDHDVRPFVDLVEGQCGFMGFSFLISHTHINRFRAHLADKDIASEDIDDEVYGQDVIKIRDPHNIPIFIVPTA